MMTLAATHPALSRATVDAVFSVKVDEARALQVRLRSLEHLAASAFDRGDDDEARMYDDLAEKLARKLKGVEATISMLFPRPGD